MIRIRPGVYIERTDASRNAPALLRTDIASFVGIAPRGPLDTPVPVESFRQYAAHFGGFTGAGYLAYAVRGFFDNGGKRCWVVRVANLDAAGGALPASVVILDAQGAAWSIRASSPGSWGNGLTLEWARETGVSSTTVPGKTGFRSAIVSSVLGLERSTLVQLEQDTKPAIYRVISAVHVAERRVDWVNPDPLSALPTDTPVIGFDFEQPIRLSRVAYSLTVRENGRVRGVYSNLHVVSTHDRYIGVVLQPPVYPAQPYVTRWPVQMPRPAEPVTVVPPEDLDVHTIPSPLQVPFSGAMALAGGSDGLVALRAYDFVGEPTSVEDSDFVRTQKTRGLQALGFVDEIALVAVPDILIRPDPDPQYEPVEEPPRNPCEPCPPSPPRTTVHQPIPVGELPPIFDDETIGRVQASLIEHCETLGDRFALLSPPFVQATASERSRDDLVEWRNLFDSRVAALYAPWVQVQEPRRRASTRLVPACGHVAGAIAQLDVTVGVQRAPGNLAIRGISHVSRSFDDTDHGELNAENVNVLRVEFGRAPMIGGARTLSHDPDWKFVNIVRMMLALKKSIDVALRWVVFEPNDSSTRMAVAATIDTLLRTFWLRGAFAGATPEESYFIRCDDTSTTSTDRDEGRLIAYVGIAPAVPLEFIILRVGQEANALSVTVLESQGVA